MFGLLLAEGKILAEVVQNIRSWKHSGFSVDQSVQSMASHLHISHLWLLFLPGRGSTVTHSTRQRTISCDGARQRAPGDGAECWWPVSTG